MAGPWREGGGTVGGRGTVGHGVFHVHVHTLAPRRDDVGLCAIPCAGSPRAAIRGLRAVLLCDPSDGNADGDGEDEMEPPPQAQHVRLAAKSCGLRVWL